MRRRSYNLDNKGVTGYLRDLFGLGIKSDHYDLLFKNRKILGQKKSPYSFRHNLTGFPAVSRYRRTVRRNCKKYLLLFSLPLVLPFIIAPNNSKCEQGEIIDSIRSTFDVDEWCIYMASGRRVGGRDQTLLIFWSNFMKFEGCNYDR